MALDGLIDFRRWDDDIAATFAGVFPAAVNHYGLAQSCPPEGPTDGLGSCAAAYYDNSGLPASTTSAVPAFFAADTTEKSYYYGLSGSFGVTAGGIECAADTIRLTRLRTSHAGSVVKAHLWLDGLGSGAGSQVAKAVIYDDNAGAPGTLMGVSAEVTVTDGQAFGRVAFTFATPVSFPTRGRYWVGIHCGSNTNTIRIGSGLAGVTSGIVGVLSNADTYSDGPASTYVGSALTGQNPYGLSVELLAAPTPASVDFSAHPATAYPDSGAQDYPFGVSLSKVVYSQNNVNLSIGGWFYFTALPTGVSFDNAHGLCGFSGSDGAGDKGFGLVVQPGGVLGFYNMGAGNNTVHWDNTSPALYVKSAAGAVTTGQWYHIVGRFKDGNTLELFVDGVLVASKYDFVWAHATQQCSVYWGKIPMDFSISGHECLFRGYMHRTWVTQEAVSDAFIGLLVESLSIPAYEAIPMVCDVLTPSAQTCDTLTMDAMVCD